MVRFLPLAAILLVLPNYSRADSFDNYTNLVLKKVAEADGVKEIKELTPVLMSENENVLPKTDAAFIVVYTNDSRYSKMLVRSGFRKIDAERKIPMLFIERFVTYKE